jgi:hypothetical protein
MNYDKLIQHYLQEASFVGNLIGGATRIGANALQNQNKTVFDTINKLPFSAKDKDKTKNPDIKSLKIGDIILVPYNDPSRDARGRIVKDPKSFIIKLKITTEPKNDRFDAEIIDRKNFYVRSVSVAGLPQTKIERFAATPPKLAPTFVVSVGKGTLYQIYRKP